MIIAISGKPNAGKDVVASHLVEKHGFVQLGLNHILRDALIALNPIIDVDHDGDPETFSEALEYYGYEGAKERDSDFRPIMQRLGSEFAEALGHPEMWVKLLMEQVEPDVDYVFSSTRRIVEANTIRAAGGLIVSITRPGTDAPGMHRVESELDHYPFDAMIPNVGTLADLANNVDYVLAELRNV